MDIHHLHIFSAVYRHKSFTKAARQINICQPTVSEHIKNLEQELGCRLFDRLGKTVVATAAADLLYPRAQQILDSVFHAKEELRAGGDPVSGEIVLGASTIPGTYILPRLIKRFRERYPGVSFTVNIEDSSRIIRMVRRHELLCALVGAKDDDAALTFTPLFKDRVILVAAPGLVPSPALDPKALAELPFVLREQGSGTRRAMEENFERLGLALRPEQVAAQFSATAAIKEAARQGLGVAVISHLAVQEELSQGTLTEIAWDYPAMERDFYFLQHQRRTLPPLYRRFADFLSESHLTALAA